MKKLLKYIIIILFSLQIVTLHFGFAEELQIDSTNVPNKKNKQIPFDSTFKTQIDSSVESTNNNIVPEVKKLRKRDLFIDSDGDGINDNRCTGLGVSKGMGMGKRKRIGQK